MEYRCHGCGNDKAWVINYKKESMTGKIYEECNQCFNPSISRNPDVYFREPYWDEHLLDWDDPSCTNEKGTWIRSKEHKAYVLKKLGIRERGNNISDQAKDYFKYLQKKGLIGR